MEKGGKFRLSQSKIESHGAYDVPEFVREFSTTAFLHQVSRREGESCVANSKRSSTSLANRG